VPRIITDWTKSQFGQLEFFPGWNLSSHHQQSLNSVRERLGVRICDRGILKNEHPNQHITY